MSGNQSTPTRRAVLSAVGTTLAAGALGTGATATNRTESQYVLEQGDRCVPIRPIRGQLSVETLYDYRLPEKYVSDANGASVGDDDLYGSLGTTDFQRSQTSIAFLYRGPQGLSLVVVHGSLDSSDGGSVTFEVTGLPGDGEWVVKDDLYRDADGEPAPSNYDRWRVDGTDHRIDWTWGSAGTDGGAFRDLTDDFAVTIDPSFNGSAALSGDHYEGTVTDWEFLSGSAGVSERISLDMDEPIRIATGSCDEASDDEREADEDDEEDGDDGDEEDAKYTVCHKPPGNPDNAHTIHVGSKSALEAHLDHGDTEGPCSEDG